MLGNNIHEGGCACAKVRYQTIGDPVHTSVCHCRFCQLRTGSAFGVSAYFNNKNVKKISGELGRFEYEAGSGKSVRSEFCVHCGTTVYWTAGSFEGVIGISGGTFDPPTFWYPIKREVFCRSKAPFSENAVPEKHETSPGLQSTM